MRLQLLPAICVAGALVIGSAGCSPFVSETSNGFAGAGRQGRVVPDLVPADNTERIHITRFELVEWDAPMGDADARVTLLWLSDAERCFLTLQNDASEVRAPVLLDGEGTTRVTLPLAVLETTLTFKLTCLSAGAEPASWTIIENQRYPTRSVWIEPQSAQAATDVTVCIEPPLSGCSVTTPLAADVVWAPTDGDGCSTNVMSQSSPAVVRCEGEPPVSAEMAIGPTILGLDLDPPVRSVPGPVMVRWRSVFTDEECQLTLPDGLPRSVGSNGTASFDADGTGDVTLQCGDVTRRVISIVGPDIEAVAVDVVTHEGTVRVEWSAPGAYDCDIRLAYGDDNRALLGVPPTGVRHLSFGFDAPGDVSTDATCRVGAMSAQQTADFAVPFIEDVAVDAASIAGWHNVCYVASGIGDGACRVIIGADWYYPLPPIGCVEVQSPAAATEGELSCDAPTGVVAVTLAVPGLTD